MRQEIRNLLEDRLFKKDKKGGGKAGLFWFMSDGLNFLQKKRNLGLFE